MDPNVDYYSVLGVPEDASTADIKKAYKQMAEAYHPDKVSSLGPKLKELANEEMKRINVARQVLCDDAERKKYNDLRKKMAKAPPPPPKDEKPKAKQEAPKTLTDEILETQSLIWEIKGMGVDTSDSEKVFDLAKFHYQQGEEDKAKAMLKDARSMAENARMYKDALNLIQKSRQMITDAAQLGADIVKANEFYAKTQPAMVNKDYVTAVYYADLTWKQATKAVEKYTFNILMKAKETLKGAQDMGLNVSKVEDVFNQAKPLVKERKFKNAVAVGKQSQSMINDIIKQYAEFKYNQANFYWDALQLEEKPDIKKKVKPMMDKLEQMYTNDHHMASLKIINDILSIEGVGAPPKVKTAPMPAKPRSPTGKPVELDEEAIEIWEFMKPDVEVQDIPEAQRKYSIYERTLYQVWEDGILEEEESRVLANLRQQYAITDKEHKEMEKKVRAALGH